jgi:hypothetical protein
MAQDQFHVSISSSTLSKMLDNIVVDNLPNKPLMISYLTRVIMKGYNGTEFFMSLTDTFPEILFKLGDKVRINQKSLYYNIDVEESTAQGYMLLDGIYAVITEVDPTSTNCYHGSVTFVNKSGSVETRNTEFNNDIILMDNTIKIASPGILPGDLI